MNKFMEKGLEYAKKINAMSDDKKRQILHKQAEKRIKKKVNINDLTNRELAKREDFKKFCLKKGVEPTKRQASKKRDMFLKWKENK